VIIISRGQAAGTAAGEIIWIDNPVIGLDVQRAEEKLAEHRHPGVVMERYDRGWGKEEDYDLQQIVEEDSQEIKSGSSSGFRYIYNSCERITQLNPKRIEHVVASFLTEKFLQL
jgi:hypothetical protein